MPRRSPNDIRPVGDTRLLLRPPEDLDELERREFASLILGAPKDHLLPSDIPLLAIYAKSIVLERTATGELKAGGYVVDGKPSAWLSVLKDATRTATTTARMLGLSPAGRWTLPAAAKKQEHQAATSYYSRMALEAKPDEAN